MSVKKTNAAIYNYLLGAVSNIELMNQNDTVDVYPSFADMDKNAKVSVPSVSYRRNGSTTNFYLDGSQDYANIQYEVVIAVDAFDDMSTIEDALVDAVMDDPDVIGVSGGTDLREADTGIWVRSVLVQMHEVV